MSRYSYRVEKLLRESKSPSLDILLEEEGSDQESEESSEKSDDNEGLENPFGSDDSNSSSDSDSTEAGDTEESPDDSAADPEAEGSDGAGAEEKDAVLDRLERFVEKSEDAGKEVDNISHDESTDSIAGDFMKALKGLSRKSISSTQAFESQNYAGKGISSFLFEDDEKDSEDAQDRIEKLSNMINSPENQIPDPLEIAKTGYRYFERFDDVDKAIYIIKLVSKYFKRFVNPEKDKVFAEFLEKFKRILHDNGVDLELDKSTATKFHSQVGARQASG